MDVVICFCCYAAAMIYCLVSGTSTAWAIVLALALFVVCGLKRGFSFKDLLDMSKTNIPASMTVIRILFILGALTGLWRSCGTIPFCIYYGVRFIKPGMFIFVTFLINMLLSLALGTSLGVSSTSGVVLISLARFGGVDPLVCAGAVMSGIYFGDRCAPTSSCANLVAAVTGTKLYDNIKLMHRTALLPYVITFAFYAVLSVMNPIGVVDEGMMNALCTEFSLSFWTVVPAVIMIVMPLLKAPLYISMGTSGLAAFLVSIFCQHMSLEDVVMTALTGFKPEGGMLAGVISGGGISSIIMSPVMVLSASLLTGVLQGMGVLDGVSEKLAAGVEKFGRLVTTGILGVAGLMVFCNQTTTNIVQAQLMKEMYPDSEDGKSELAMDIANTGVVIAGLVPWCVACSVPLDTLGVGIGALPYSVLLYAIPLCYLFTKKKFFKADGKKD